MSEAIRQSKMLKNKKIKKAHVAYSEQDTQSKKIGPNSIQNDKRFSKATYDPKFLTPGSKITKVKIDKRFSKMLNDPSFKTTSKIDRYGRTVNQQDENKQLNQYYYMDELAENEEVYQDQQ